MEPISLLIILGTLGVGFLGGRLTSRKRTPKPIQPICGCQHGLHTHDPKTGECKAEIPFEFFNDGVTRKTRYIPCECRQYTGPRPFDQFWVPEMLPPSSSD